MKKYTCIYCLLILLFACNSTDKKEQEIARLSIDTEIVLFHDILFSAQEDDLSTLKESYPYMFPAEMPDDLVLERMKDKEQRFVYDEIKKVYPDFKTQEKEIHDLFKHIKYYINDFDAPTVVTDITGVSYKDRVLYSGPLLLISLDMFLGKENEIYNGISEYILETFTPKHITTAIAHKIIETQYSKNKDRSLLGQMIFEGKKLYLQDLFLPNVTDEVKLGYTSKKMEWSKLNESTIWAFFIKNEMLYSNDAKLKQRFIDFAPFSKFFTSIDKDSPGSIGKFIGLQIVRAYAENHDFSIQELLDTDAQTILSTSGYKPKKR